MMLGGRAFSDAGGGVTMRPHWSDSGALVELQHKTQLSEQDVHRVQAMYIKPCSRRQKLGQDT